MSSIVPNTPSERRIYGKKHRMGTMGILRRGDKVLLIHRRKKTETQKTNGPPDTWAFAGGALDEDETPEEAVRREIKEELGVDVVIKKIGDEHVWGEVDNYLNEPWRCFFFVVEQVDESQEPKVMEPDKHVAIMWIDWKEMWSRIEAEVPGNPNEDGMRFFQAMKNMVQKYPKRADPACLERRL